MRGADCPELRCGDASPPPRLLPRWVRARLAQLRSLSLVGDLQPDISSKCGVAKSYIWPADFDFLRCLDLLCASALSMDSTCLIVLALVLLLCPLFFFVSTDFCQFHFILLMLVFGFFADIALLVQ